MICRISMQNCVQDLFDTIFSRYMCYDTVSTYDTTLISLIINYGDTSAFSMHGMHDTNYDTTIVTSLIKLAITASLREGPFFYFYVESPPSIFMHH
jgi:hypothetical protein